MGVGSREAEAKGHVSSGIAPSEVHFEHVVEP